MSSPIIEIEKILPLSKVENGAILSTSGDITIAFEVRLPEIFTLSDRDYEAYHQAFVKAIRLLPAFSIFHKQDWFTEAAYTADFEKAGKSFCPVRVSVSSMNALIWPTVAISS